MGFHKTLNNKPLLPDFFFLERKNGLFDEKTYAFGLQKHRF